MKNKLYYLEKWKEYMCSEMKNSTCKCDDCRYNYSTNIIMMEECPI